MNKIKFFIMSSYEEMMTKVTWPSYLSLRKNATMILVSAIIFAILVGIVDRVFEQILQFIYNTI